MSDVRRSLLALRGGDARPVRTDVRDGRIHRRGLGFVWLVEG